MNDRNILRFDRAFRVQTFGRDNSADFAPDSKAAEHFLELTPIITKLESDRVGKLRQPVGKKVCIDALNEDFKDIARTARAIVLDDADFPISLYRRPRTRSETPIATHADALLLLLEDQDQDTPAQITQKQALRAKFVAYELPEDFVEDLRADSDALTACNQEKHTDLQESVESTAAIDTLLDQVQGIITRLDAAVKNKYARVPEKLAAWRTASRIARSARPAKSDTPAPTPPTA
jgi:hypothetical protein